MPKPSTWSSWETKARHAIIAAGLGMGAAVMGSWVSAWLPLPSQSPFLAYVFAGWTWNAWLWLVFAPMALVVARVFPVNTTSFVGVGGATGFLFWFFFNTALFGVERFLEFPWYAASCGLWFIAGLFWAKGFARRGEYWFRKAKENAQAIAKSNEHSYAQWVAASAQVPSGEAETAETKTDSK